MTIWQFLSSDPSSDLRARHRLAAALACACLLAPGLAAALSTPALAATLEVGPGKTYEMPSAAAAAAHDGDRIVIAPGS